MHCLQESVSTRKLTAADLGICFLKVTAQHSYDSASHVFIQDVRCVCAAITALLFDRGDSLRAEQQQPSFRVAHHMHHPRWRGCS